MNDTPISQFFLIVEAESDGITLKLPVLTLPGLDSVTWERLRIHNEVEALDWELAGQLEVSE